MKLTKLKLFIHDSNKRNGYYIHLFSFLNKIKLTDYIIDKGYEDGYHIQIISKGKEVNKQLNLILDDFHKYIPLRVLNISERKLESQVINKLRNMEEFNYKESSFDSVVDEGKYLLEEIEKNYFEQKFKMRFDEIWKILIMRQKFLEKYLLNIDRPYSEYLYLLLFCSISANTFHSGIREGAISYRSNYEYYMKQISLISLNETKKKEIIDFINHRTLEDKEAEECLVSLIFKEKNYKGDAITHEFYEFINQTKKIIFDNFEHNLVFNQNLYTANDFFERVESPSDFHKKFYKIPSIIRLYENKEFIIHRYILSFLYSIFPLINVTNRMKQKVIGHVASIIERQFDYDIKKEVFAWNQQISEK